MRPFERAPGGGITRAIGFQHGAVAILDLDGGRGRDNAGHPAIERDLRRRKVDVMARGERAGEAANGFGACGGYRDRKFCRLVFDGVEPV